MDHQDGLTGRKKIVLLGRYRECGIFTGPEKAAKEIFGMAEKHQLDPVFVEYFFDGEKYSILKKLFGNELVIINRKKIFKKGIIPLIFFLISCKPDIIHLITFERIQTAAFFYSLLFNTKIICHVHGIVTLENEYNAGLMSGFVRWKNNLLAKLYYSRSDRIIFPSILSRELAGKYYRFSAGKTEIIPNGIDESLLRFSILKEDKSRLRIVFVGELSRPEKGLSFLLETFKIYKLNCSLTIVGRKGDEEKTGKMPDVRFYERAGYDDYTGILRMNDIIICASELESFSIATLEGMAIGLVPVISSSAGISEYLQDGKNCFIFRCGEMESLAGIIVRLDNNRDLLLSVSGAAKESAISFSWGFIFKNSYLPLYEKISKK